MRPTLCFPVGLGKDLPLIEQIWLHQCRHKSFALLYNPHFCRWLRPFLQPIDFAVSLRPQPIVASVVDNAVALVSCGVFVSVVGRFINWDLLFSSSGSSG